MNSASSLRSCSSTSLPCASNDLRALGMRPWFGRTLTVASAGKSFDAQGKLVDEQLRKLLSEFMAGYAEFLRR